MAEVVAKLVFEDKDQIFLALSKTLLSLDAEMPLIFDRGKLTVQAIDPAHIFLLRTTFPKKWFEEWEIYPGFKKDEREMSIDPEVMKLILYQANKDDKISLIYSIDKKKTGNIDRFLNIIVENQKRRKEYITEVSDISSRVRYPSLNLDTTIEMETSDFIAYVKEINWYCDNITFTVNRGKFTIGSSCEGTGVKITPAANVRRFNEYARTEYPIDYLVKTFSFLKIHDKMMIEFETDYPMHIYVTKDGVKTDMLLAPKIPS